MATTAGLVEAVSMHELMLAAPNSRTDYGIVGPLEEIASAARRQLEEIVTKDPELLRLWQAIDLTLTVLIGILRFNLVSDPRGFDAVNDYDFREWLRLNGASDRSLESPLIRGAYDLMFAYKDGDHNRPSHAAGSCCGAHSGCYLARAAPYSGKCARAWATWYSRRITRF
ncbi:MAG: hypothetical protein ACREQN_15145 [Candidatus Binataceae bacterium]